MPKRKSPALQRFDRLLENQCQFNAFLELGSAQLSTDYDPIEGEDFTLRQCGGLWHWDSCGETFSDGYCAEEGFYTEDEAVTDATESLSELYAEESETLQDPDVLAAICRSEVFG